MDELIDQLRTRIIDRLQLEDITPEEIDADEPLFGEGLGLDSIDAVEIVVVLEKDYGIKLKDMESAQGAFESVRALATFITAEIANGDGATRDA